MTDLWPAGETPPLAVQERGIAAIRQADSVAGLTGAVEAAGDDGIPDVAVRAARAALAYWRDDGDALADTTHRHRLALQVTAELRRLLGALGWRNPDGTVPPTLAALGVNPGWTGETWAAHGLRTFPDGSEVELPVAGVWVAWFDGQRERPAEWLDWLARVEAAEAAGRRRGVAWLSAALADVLDGVAAGAGDKWTVAEARREGAERAQETHPWAGRDPIPGWRRESPDEGTVDELRQGSSKALRALAGLLWDARLRPEVKAERPLYSTTMALLPLAEGWAAGRGRGGEWGERWDVSAVDPTLVRTIEQRGTLATVEAHALWRRLPDVARLAANAEGRAVALYSAPGGYVSAHATRGHRTEVDIRGGWQMVAAWLGYTGGKPRTALKAAAHALAGASYRWHAKGAGDVEGTLTLVSDLVDDAKTGRVSFLLPRLWWPGFARELSGKSDRERGARAMVPMPPTLPPSTSTRLGEGPARLETGALLWMRGHLGSLTPTGAPVPWERLADDVRLSTARQRSRRIAVLEGLLALWARDGRWHREGELWRPDYGWAKLLEAQEAEAAGRRRSIEGRKRRNPDGTRKRRRKRAPEK